MGAGKHPLLTLRQCIAENQASRQSVGQGVEWEGCRAAGGLPSLNVRGCGPGPVKQGVAAENASPQAVSKNCAARLSAHN
jgi:hypothetical protein